jgi:hypothetical protein
MAAPNLQGRFPLVEKDPDREPRLVMEKLLKLS